MINVLITGSTGFVGAELIKYFKGAGLNVIAGYRNRSKIPQVFHGELRYFTFEDDTNYDYLLKDIDVVCHTASWATMWGHKKQEEEMFYTPSKKLINAARERGIKKFILTSTIAANPKSQSFLADGLSV